MKAAVLFWFLLGIWIDVFSGLEAVDDVSFDKRYIAALAKNGRLPKFNHPQKKSQMLDGMEENNGLSFEQISVPNEVDPEKHSEVIFDLPEDIASEYFPYWEPPEKRNVAALARLGRLNTIRYGRFQPHFVNGKRVSSEDDNEIDSQINDKNELDDIDIECLPYDVDDQNGEIDNFLNGKQKKRYVAALARSGRLPIWHSQRMWGGRKRDDSYPAFNSNPRMDIDNDLDNRISGIPYFKRKQKRCKKVFGYKRQKRSVEKFEEENTSDRSSDNLGLDIQEEKRNVAALARNGKLPLRRYGKRSEDMNESKFISENNDEDNQNAVIAPNEKLYQSSNSEDKRNIAALARKGKMPSFKNMEMKRNIAALARNGKLFTKSFSEGKRDNAILDENELDIAEKRNVAALARNGKLPSFYSVNGKRNLQALARNGKLPAFTGKKRSSDEVDQDEKIFDQFTDDKRNVAALARNGKMPLFNEVSDKRNIAALARNGKLPEFSFSEDKRNLAALARSGKLPAINRQEDKRNIASLARSGKLPSFNSNEDKRNIASLARKGKLRSFNFAEDKRNVAALARNGKLPMFNSGEDKRNMAALARNGKLPMFNSGEDKRNMAALARNGKLPSLRDINGKRNLAALARNNKLPAFYSRAEKRNIAALAQRGKLPAFNNIDEKREVFPLPETYYQENKRNIAALARKGQLHFHTLGGKRNMAALARNGKLLGLNQRDKYSLESEIPDEKWEEVELEENEK